MAAPQAQEALRNAAPTISAGILSADLTALGAAVATLERSGVKLLHFDVMDGCFVPPMTFGPSVIKAIKTSLLKDVHLMITEPLGKVADYVEAGADMITVHAESGPHMHRVLQMMESMVNTNDRDRGIVRGLAICPGTPVEDLEPFLDLVDMITILAINPGWSGQKFLDSTPGRIAKTRQILEKAGKDILLCVDGGITRANAADVARLGADILVTGSAVFDGGDPAANAGAMISAMRSARDARVADGRGAPI